MRKLLVFCGMAVFMLWATPASATSITDACPRLNGGNSGGLAPDVTYAANAAGAGNNLGCNVLITFGPGGTIFTTKPNTQGFYDSGGDDNMIGIVNLSGSTLTSINLSSATVDIFGFDGDGACGTTGGAGGGIPGYTASNGSMATFCGVSDTSGYMPAGTSQTHPNVFNGTVTFGGGGLASGQAAWFSLEGPVALDLQVTPGVPEPGSLILLSTGILLVARRLRKA